MLSPSKRSMALFLLAQFALSQWPMARALSFLHLQHFYRDIVSGRLRHSLIPRSLSINYTALGDKKCTLLLLWCPCSWKCDIIPNKNTMSTIFPYCLSVVLVMVLMVWWLFWGVNGMGYNVNLFLGTYSDLFFSCVEFHPPVQLVV